MTTTGGSNQRAPRGFEGEALVLLVRMSLRPRFLAALHHLRSPVGPSVELVAGEWGLPLTRRRGLRETTLAVSGGLARPEAERSALKWWSQGDLREVIWEDRELRIHAEISRRAFPMTVPGRLLHPGWPGDDHAPPRIPVRFRRARVEIEVPKDDPLVGWLAGRCPAVLLSTRATTPILERARATLTLPTIQAPAAPEPT